MPVSSSPGPISASVVVLLLAGAAVGGSLAAEKPAEGPAVLARRCLSCHNAEKKSGGLDLSTRTGAVAAGVTGPDDPAHNRLVRAVTEGRMPPGGRLPAGETQALRAWVKSGMVYPAVLPNSKPETRNPKPPLWSLQPVRRPAIPRTPFDALARNPIDRFLFARLAARGLRPSPPASRLALLRRVTVDLTGLPPTPEEVTAFLADRSPDAYEKVVDRLLASPAYGERWGRHWLDVVRFGESHGYEQNHIRPNAWPYRDYVIRALNADTPFPRFVAEQLAGDVLAKGDPAVEAATGFLVAGVHDTVGNQTEEGTRQKRANDLDDMVSATAEAFLGMTVGCAKCHDHKFDPIPQKDYYRLAAVFSGVQHGERKLTPTATAEAAQREQEASRRRLRLLQAQVLELDTEARLALLRSRGQTPSRPAVSARRNVERFAPVQARFVRFVVERTKDGTEPCLDELEVYGPDGDANLALASTGARPTASSLYPGQAIHQIQHLNDGKYGNDWSWISAERGGGWAQIELPQPARVSRVVWSRDSAERPRFSDRLAAAYRVEVSEDGAAWKTVATGADRAETSESLPETDLAGALAPAQREQRSALQAEAAALSGKLAAQAGSETAYVGVFSAPEPVHLLKRGDVMQRGEEVSPGGLSSIPGLGAELPKVEDAPAEPAQRLALARWIADPRNPLPARVMVNRLWQGHFGRGLVGTPSDFGRNGETPSHPELLDWLAAGFAGVSSSANLKPETSNLKPGSLKALHRLMVTSYAYRQTSDANSAGLAKDAGNRLLWRMPLRRMEAEAVRDAILATSGKLDRRMGGPSYQLYRYRTVNVAIYEPLEEYGPDTWRRGVYRQTARAIHDDLLGPFDCPETSQRTPRRESTTTALQALGLLNGKFVVQQAGFFAERVGSAGGPAAQVDRAFRLAFGRAPVAEERAAALKLLSSAGLPALCRALLNANEFLYY